MPVPKSRGPLPSHRIRTTTACTRTSSPHICSTSSPQPPAASCSRWTTSPTSGRPPTARSIPIRRPTPRSGKRAWRWPRPCVRWPRMPGSTVTPASATTASFRWPAPLMRASTATSSTISCRRSRRQRPSTEPGCSTYWTCTGTPRPAAVASASPPTQTGRRSARRACRRPAACGIPGTSRTHGSPTTSSEDRSCCFHGSSAASGRIIRGPDSPSPSITTAGAPISAARSPRPTCWASSAGRASKRPTCGTSATPTTPSSGRPSTCS